MCTSKSRPVEKKCDFFFSPPPSWCGLLLLRCETHTLTHHSLSLLPEVSQFPSHHHHHQPPLKPPHQSVWKPSVSPAAHYRRRPPNAGAPSPFIAFRLVVLWRASVACALDAIAPNCTSPQTPRLVLFGTRAFVPLLPQTLGTLFTVCFCL